MNDAIQPDTQQYTSAPTRRGFNIYGAAEYCSCRCAAIEDAIRDGRLRARRLGRGFVITREDLDAFIDLLPAVEPHIPPSVAARRASRAANTLHSPDPRKQMPTT